MIIETVVVEEKYHAPVSKIWKAITDKEEMKKWYFELSDFKPEPGFEFNFSGQGKEGENYLHLCKVIEAIPEKKLVYSWRYDGYPGVSYISFELFAEGDDTKIKLTHSGIENLSVNGAAFARENFQEGWQMIIGKSLKEFAEK